MKKILIIEDEEQTRKNLATILRMEGHQPPYLALGDYTMLEPGMCFSVEPGLFDPETGFGCNFSDNFIVEPTGPSRQHSRLPWSEDWCLVKL